MVLFCSVLFATTVEEEVARCEKGDLESCVNAGLSYRDEKTLDYEKSNFYFNKCCKLGMAKCCWALGVIYEQAKIYRQARGTKKDITLAKSYLKKACELGYKQACWRLEKLQKIKNEK